LRLSCTAIILAGGFSRRFGVDKVFVEFSGKPLVRYVIETARELADETLVVAGIEQSRRLLEFSNGEFTVLVDRLNVKSPLAGAYTGLERARGEISLLLACDTPLLSKDVLRLLLQLSPEHDAVIPKWPNGNIEPLQATYSTSKALDAANEALRNNELRMYDAIRRLGNTLYVSTDTLRKYDPELHTFENINTPDDLRRVERIWSSTTKPKA
jgi:molybdopterin-guanine dinucleotide biosynthesis protein A